MDKVTYEICCFSVEDAIAAQTGGADRIELCVDPILGGVTPSLGLFRIVKSLVSIPVWPIIRPRGGNFCFTNAEKKVILSDIDAFCTEGADGVVLGFLTLNQQVDKSFLKEAINICNPLSWSFHKAIDSCINPEHNLNTLIDLGCRRILSSGQSENVVSGLHKLKKWQFEYGHLIEIMAGGGVRFENVELLYESGIRHMHASLRNNMLPADIYQQIESIDVQKFVSAVM